MSVFKKNAILAATCRTGNFYEEFSPSCAVDYGIKQVINGTAKGKTCYFILGSFWVRF
jgi:hypothetical protein